MLHLSENAIQEGWGSIWMSVVNNVEQVSDLEDSQSLFRIPFHGTLGLPTLGVMLEGWESLLDSEDIQQHEADTHL